MQNDAGGPSDGLEEFDDASQGLAALVVALAATRRFAEDAPKPKFGPKATPIFQENNYLREAPAPDYWNLSPFYIPQRTSSDCSLAAIAMVVNALRGLPANADQELVTENSLMATVNDQDWMVKVTEDGPGVTFDEPRSISVRRSISST